MEKPSEKDIEETAVLLITRASFETLRDTICALCAEIGLNEMRGIPVRTYIDAQERLHQDELCADLADSSPSMASYVRQVLLSLRS